MDYETTLMSYESAIAKMSDRSIMSCLFLPGTSPIRYVLVNVPGFPDEGLCLWHVTVESGSYDYLPIFDVVSRIKAAEYVVVSLEEALDFESEIPTRLSKEWRSPYLIVGGVRSLESDSLTMVPIVGEAKSFVDGQLNSK